MSRTVIAKRTLTNVVVAMDTKQTNSICENDTHNTNSSSKLSVVNKLSTTTNTTDCEHPRLTESEYGYFDENEQNQNLQQTLRHHKSNFNEYKKKWNWQENDKKAPQAPHASWPLNVAQESELDSLKMALEFCNRNSLDSGDKSNCNNLQFRIASYLLLQTEEGDAQQRGLNIIKELAEKHNDPDAMCAYATCLNTGQAGLKYNANDAMKWWETAAHEHGHLQSMYELGVGYFTGEGVEGDEQKAVDYFQKSAECGHVGAAYMLGDCLLDGVGIEKDQSEALEWLVTAAEFGHVSAWSRVFAVLEGKDADNHGDFTDTSQKTLNRVMAELEMRKYFLLQSNISLQNRFDWKNHALL